MRANNNIKHISPYAEFVLVDTNNSKFGNSVNNLQELVQNIDDMAVSGVPFASTTISGLTRVATVDEVLAGTNEFAYVTPKTLQEKWIRPLATTTTIGTVQLANATNRNFENRSDLFVVSTSGLWDILRNRSIADSTIRGTVRLSSITQAELGTDNTTAMTPQTVKRAIDTFAVTDVPGASESVAGTIRNVSNAALTADKHTGYAVSPKNFLESNATETKNGTVRIATQALANGLTNNTTVITPARIPKASTTQQGIVLLSHVPIEGGNNIALSAAGAFNSVVARSNGFAQDIKIVNSIDYRNSSNMNSTLWSQSWDNNRLKFHAGGDFSKSLFEIDKSGVIRSGGNIIAFQYSDSKLKSKLVRVNNIRKRLRDITPTTYIQKDMEDQGRQLGVIAQDVQTRNPELVARDENDILKVNYSGLTALSIGAINELYEKIDLLKREIIEINKQIAKK